MFPPLCVILGFTSNNSRNKGRLGASYCMNALRRGSRRPNKERAVKMYSRCSAMTRARTTYLNRNLVRHSRSRNVRLTSGALLSYFHDRQSLPLHSPLDPLAARPSDSKHQMARSRSMFKLAIRLGRSFSAHAACAPARRIGISVWRSDFWVKRVRVR
jgi:hypothetical protein